MSIQYESLLDQIINDVVEAIEREQTSLYWDESVDEVIEEYVYSQMQTEDHLEVLKHAKPHDEWQVYCTDMTDPVLVYEAMCRVALRIQVIERMKTEHSSLIADD